MLKKCPYIGIDPLRPKFLGARETRTFRKGDPERVKNELSCSKIIRIRRGIILQSLRGLAALEHIKGGKGGPETPGVWSIYR